MQMAAQLAQVSLMFLQRVALPAARCPPRKCRGRCAHPRASVLPRHRPRHRPASSSSSLKKLWGNCVLGHVPDRRAVALLAILLELSERECVICRGSLMGARLLIARASFGPDTIKAMGEAFDQAWAEIAFHFEGDPLVRDSARQSLAEAVLGAAGDSIPDVQGLKEASLRAMRRDYKALPIAAPQVADWDAVDTANCAAVL